MHEIQEKLLGLSKRENLAALSLREIAGKLGYVDASPQRIKHHLLQLQKRGFLAIDRSRGTMATTALKPSIARGLVSKGSVLFSIPIVGSANCGPATIFAEENFQGFLRISKRLLGRSRPDGLYAIKAAGSSMNQAEIHGKRIEDGDLVIVDSKNVDAHTGDVVLAIIDSRATVKRFVDDRVNGQIVLAAESSFDYEPIYLHEDDDFQISGKIIDVIKRPKA
jgi:SOS-response transcriptional repressor LexA